MLHPSYTPTERAFSFRFDRHMCTFYIDIIHHVTILQASVASELEKSHKFRAFESKQILRDRTRKNRYDHVKMQARSERTNGKGSMFVDVHRRWHVSCKEEDDGRIRTENASCWISRKNSFERLQILAFATSFLRPQDSKRIVVENEQRDLHEDASSHPRCERLVFSLRTDQLHVER